LALSWQLLKRGLLGEKSGGIIGLTKAEGGITGLTKGEGGITGGGGITGLTGVGDGSADGSKDGFEDGSLEGMQWEEMPIFGLQVPSTGIKDVPLETLQPLKAWQMNGQSESKFQETAIGLAHLFQGNFQEYADLCSPEVIAAGPKA